MQKCIICIGSNYNRKENLFFCTAKAGGFVSFHPFHVRTGNAAFVFSESGVIFQSGSTVLFRSREERVRKELKAIEKSAGRCPEDKKEEKVCLDIDLLAFDDRVLKPEDLKREYIVKGLEELK